LSSSSFSVEGVIDTLPLIDVFFILVLALYPAELSHFELSAKLKN
jgi:hypothetical protein